MAKATQFLRFEDDGGKLAVLGESFDKKHVDEIDITGWNWGITDPTLATTQSKAKAGESSPKQKSTGDSPQPSLLHFSKFTDRSTTRLLQAMSSGEVFRKAVLVIEESFVPMDDDDDDEQRRFYLEVEISKARVVHFSWSVQAEEAAGVSMTEQWDLSYSAVSFSYRRRGGQGWIDRPFPWAPVDSAEAKKAPLTAAEKKDAYDTGMEDYFKRHPELRGAPKRGK